MKLIPHALIIYATAVVNCFLSPLQGPKYRVLPNIEIRGELLQTYMAVGWSRDLIPSGYDEVELEMIRSLNETLEVIG